MEGRDDMLTSGTPCSSPTCGETPGFPTRERPTSDVDVLRVSENEWRKIEVDVAKWLTESKYQMTVDEKKPFFRVANYSLTWGLAVGVGTNIMFNRFGSPKPLIPNWVPSLFLGFCSAQMTVKRLRKTAFQDVLLMPGELGDRARIALADSRQATAQPINSQTAFGRTDKYSSYYNPSLEGVNATSSELFMEAADKNDFGEKTQNVGNADWRYTGNSELGDSSWANLTSGQYDNSSSGSSSSSSSSGSGVGGGDYNMGLRSASGNIHGGTISSSEELSSNQRNFDPMGNTQDYRQNDRTYENDTHYRDVSPMEGNNGGDRDKFRSWDDIRRSNG